MFAKQLMQLQGVTAEKARDLVGQFPTPQRFGGLSPLPPPLLLLSKTFSHTPATSLMTKLQTTTSEQRDGILADIKSPDASFVRVWGGGAGAVFAEPVFTPPDPIPGPVPQAAIWPCKQRGCSQTLYRCSASLNPKYYQSGRRPGLSSLFQNSPPSPPLGDPHRGR